MKRWTVLACAFVAMLAWGAVAQAGVESRVSLDFYRATVSQKAYEKLLSDDVDVTAAKNVAGNVRIDLVLTRAQAGTLRAEGVDVKLLRNSKGQTARQAAAAQLVGGFNVWRPYDGQDGLRAWMYKTAKDNPQLIKLEVIGRTGQGREIIALKLTQSAKDVPDNTRPAVLYSATQHAREWIAPEVDRRMLQWFIDKWRANDKTIKDLLKQRELWFVLVCNPDGYEYTFQSPDTRLWRKNLRDNNGDGITQVGDGVDPNRNYPFHWNYDNEGSSGAFSSDTYRGPGPASEAETTAIRDLFNRVDFKLQTNYHSYGPWLLYPQGWQIGTPTGDDPIFYALAGNRDNPAIPGFRPGLSSDVLYVTNGEMTDFAYSRRGTISYTPELEEGCTGCGFVFPDNEALVQAEFEKTIAFNLDLARSAADPAHPTSHLGITTKPFYLKSDDTYKFGLPEANFTFSYSYGDPQKVQVLALRSLGAVTVNWKVNGGATHTAPTDEWTGGERYSESTSRWYRVMRGEVSGTSPGDSVEVWFTGGGLSSPSFTYQAVSESLNKVLIMSAEDYTGASPVQDPNGPHYLSFYTDALSANGIGFDVYDVDAHNRTAPTYLGVLSHYKSVIWYTGDDAIPRDPGWSAGNATRVAMDEILHIRSYLNEGGKVLYTGSFAGHGYGQGHGAQLYDPTEANARCLGGPGGPVARCLALYGSPQSDLQNDVLEYWFGSYILNEDAGTGDDGNLLDVVGVQNPFSPADHWGFNGDDSAQNQFHSASFITTSGILPVSDYPQFESWVAAAYDRPGGPFAPHTGTYDLYSQIADISYKQVTRTVTVPAGGGNFSFWVSHDTEQDWDYVFVEAHTVGADDYTTLPDQNGHTGTDTGQSCPAGWNTLHPHLDHFQTINADGTCSPTGTTGSWNASTGNSGGWQEWSIDLAPFAGKTIELSVSYVSDWATQGLGVFLDDFNLMGEMTSFETGLDGWSVTGPPAGSGLNANNFERTTAEGFPEGAVIATPDTLYMGFGFEGISDAATRADVMGKAMDFLGH
jgi:Zinc carboxypeptidase